MIKDNDILALLFKIINVSGITSIITGKVYVGEKPLESIKEDIVIGMLTNKHEANGTLITGEININCFVTAINNHTRNASRLSTITDAVITVLNLSYDEGHTSTLNYKIVSQKTFRDFDNPSLYYSNIRLKFTYKN
jgi:Na+/H+ antiporter NhaB